MSRSDGRTIAAWIGLGLTVASVIVGVTWQARSYADEVASRAVAASATELRAHEEREAVRRDEAEARGREDIREIKAMLRDLTAQVQQLREDVAEIRARQGRR